MRIAQNIINTIFVQFMLQREIPIGQNNNLHDKLELNNIGNIF